MRRGIDPAFNSPDGDRCQHNRAGGDDRDNLHQQGGCVGIQERADRRHLSRIIAANNIINSFFIVCAAGLALTLLNAGLTIPELFLALACLNGVVAATIFIRVPEFSRRFLSWIRGNAADPN